MRLNFDGDLVLLQCLEDEEIVIKDYSEQIERIYYGISLYL
jgi:hypothetical protein